MNSKERVFKAFKKMEGTPDRVPIQFDLCRQHTESFGKILGKNRGYLLAPAHILQTDVSADTIEKMIRAAMESGTY